VDEQFLPRLRRLKSTWLGDVLDDLGDPVADSMEFEIPASDPRLLISEDVQSSCLLAFGLSYS